jgi:DNA-binding GntR family transcriptional regulator
MDGDSAIPPYAWIAWQLRDAIRAGTPGIGGPVLSESELAEQYGVSRMTAGKVLGLLAAEGLIQRRRDSGSVVARQISWERIPAEPGTIISVRLPHGQRACGGRRRRVCPPDQRAETRLRRTAVCSRCRYRGGNGPVSRIRRSRLSAVRGPVLVYRHQSFNVGILVVILPVISNCRLA